MKIPLSELNGMKPDIVGANTKVYFLGDGKLAKRFLRMKDNDKRDRLRRYEYAKKIGEIKGLSLPVDVLETEYGFCGYIENLISTTTGGTLSTFVDYVNERRETITLDDIVSYMLKVCDIVDRCHQHGIINPDMASERNVLFDLDSRDVHLLDYQDMQVGPISTNAISSFIATDPIIRTSKYYNAGLYTKNIDLYTLAIRFFYYATKINVPRSIQNGSRIDELVSEAGIINTSFGECMQTLYKPNVNNLDIRDSIKELSAGYQLSEFRKGQVRILIKKR